MKHWVIVMELEFLFLLYYDASWLDTTTNESNLHRSLWWGLCGLEIVSPNKVNEDILDPVVQRVYQQALVVVFGLTTHRRIDSWQFFNHQFVLEWRPIKDDSSSNRARSNSGR